MGAGLLLVCLISFIAVFTVLLVLSGLMALINSIFPGAETKTEDSTATYAAISAIMANIYPNHKLTKIEEQK